MASSYARDRARRAIEQLGTTRLDWAEFSDQVIGQLQRSVGFDGWCLAQVDPATLLPGQASTQGSPVAACQERFWQIEYHLKDVNSLASLVSGEAPVRTLSTATGGDLARSRRGREIMRPAGVVDELRAALTTGGYCWGTLTLYRASGRPYTDEDIAHLMQVLGAAAAGARGTWAAPNPAPDAGADDGPGTIIVTAAGTPLSATPEARRWLARLSPDPRASQAIVYAVTTLVTAPATSPRAAPAARVRVRVGDGLWLDIHASLLAAARSGGDIAVTIQAAAAARIRPLLMRAYTLSARERQIAELMLDGRTPAEIALALHISLYTAKDHIKAIFRKTGTHSRPELTRSLTGHC